MWKGYAATGGSAIKAVEVLKEHGVPEERIIFVNLVRVLDLDSEPRVRFRVGRHSREMKDRGSSFYGCASPRSRRRRG